MPAATPKCFSYAIHGGVDSLRACLRSLEDSEAYQDMPSALQFVAELVLDELVTNTIKYGGNEDPTIECELAFDGKEMSMTISDDALPYDPWSTPPLAALETDDVENIVIGGRGIHMLRNATDERSYQRTGGKNVVKVARGIRPPQNWMRAA